MPCQHHCQTLRQLPCPTVITSQSLPSVPNFQRRQLLSPTRRSGSHAKRYCWLRSGFQGYFPQLHLSGLDFLSVSRLPDLKARRKDSPLLPVMIPTGEDGQVGLCSRRVLCLNGLLTKHGLQEVTDMFTHMLRNRIIFVGQRINDEVWFSSLWDTSAHRLFNSRKSTSVHVQLATQIVASLLALEAADEARDIQLYINSQGEAVPSFA